ncbi:amidohydrolase family protein [Amnibacterium flavum]|uniref:N-acyl-D-aspartate/D-glutamate deacylase n=1 Tax=Amnibacterium flavum TaxID=2173173 RepID=A0A2V1HTK6_9MICO|nr:amidohydrolase family protein [Amnibacterium flavum]PVZ95012.1 N-acyl-D-aspartate/D-glutamate deacylase [Amnibacterium flavum]
MTVRYETVLTGGSVVDGSGAEPRRADVGISGGRIAAVGDLGEGSGARTIEISGRYLLPGFIDVHSHADSLVATDPVADAYLRQGVTTVIVGQDGLSFAPNDRESAQFVDRYFAAIGGRVPPGLLGGAEVGELLESYDRRGPLNTGLLLGAGSIRARAVGFDERDATDGERLRMRDLVARGMAEGALGVSTGLDYVPGRFAGTAELAELMIAVGEAGGVHASHLRGYAHHQLAASLAEMAQISASSGAIGHVSHLHGPAALVAGALDRSHRLTGVDLTFDSYPYLRGSTIVAMLLLPPELQAGGTDATLSRLAEPSVRALLRDEILPRSTRLDSIVLSFVGDPAYAWAEGHGLREAAEIAGRQIEDFVCDILIAADLAVGCVVDNGADRTEADVRQLLAHPGQLAGSDAIFLGSRPHPRGWGAFARLLGRHVRELGDWTWGQAARHLSGHAADRFGLAGRGTVTDGAVADLVVLDPDTVSDVSTYDDPIRPAVGVDLVLIGGETVLADGRRTAARPGRALRHRDSNR